MHELYSYIIIKSIYLLLDILFKYQLLEVLTKIY